MENEGQISIKCNLCYIVEYSNRSDNIMNSQWLFKTALTGTLNTGGHDHHICLQEVMWTIVLKELYHIELQF